MKNRDLFVRDPAVTPLMNNGQARIDDGRSDQERNTLREELSNFVCEGQYADGTLRIFESFLGQLGSTSQPAAWVSGFQPLGGRKNAAGCRVYAASHRRAAFGLPLAGGTR